MLYINKNVDSLYDFLVQKKFHNNIYSQIFFELDENIIKMVCSYNENLEMIEIIFSLKDKYDISYLHLIYLDPEEIDTITKDDINEMVTEVVYRFVDEFIDEFVD